ncbi:MAG: glycosyltransferase [Bacteroidota bacterium]
MAPNTCFVTVIFPNNLPFLGDFLESLANQKQANFDLLIFNDQASGVASLLKSYPFNFQLIDVNGNSIEIRSKLLRFLKESHYSYCVFGDSDDYFPPNRVSTNIELLQEHDIVINDLNLVNNHKKSLSEYYLSSRLHNYQLITHADIVDKNILGLGNTAIRMEALPEKLDFPEGSPAVDWMLFSRMLLNGKKAIFSSDTFIYYRQHSGNQIGIKNSDEGKILKGIEIKYLHYQTLNKEYGIFQNELQEIEHLKSFLNSENHWHQYLNKLEALRIEFPLWWEEIKPLNKI